MFLNRFHANQTCRKIQTNHSRQIKHNHLITRPRLSSCALIPQQMPTSVPLSENFISNYTMKKLHSAVLNIKNSRNALRKKKKRKKFDIDQTRPISNSLCIKKAILKTGMKLNMQIGLRPKQYLAEILQDFSYQTWYEFPLLSRSLQVSSATG